MHANQSVRPQRCSFKLAGILPFSRLLAAARNTFSSKHRSQQVGKRTLYIVKTRSIFADFRTLFRSVTTRRRRQLILLFGLMLLGAVAEIVSLGAVIPFLGILSDPELAIQQPFVSKLVDLLGLAAGNELRFQLTVLFSATAIIAGLVRFALIFVTAHVNCGMVHELGSEVYRRTLYQNYDIHVQRNSSEIVGAIEKLDVIAWATLSLLTATGGLFMAISIVATLVYVSPVISLTALVGLGSIYAFFSLITRRRLDLNSEIIGEAYGDRVQAVQEGIGGIRDVILDHAHELFVDRFNQVDRRMRRSQASNAIIDPSPRFGVEALGMVLIASLAYILTMRDGSMAGAFPLLGALALGAQRLMPLLQQVYRCYVYLAGNRRVIHDVAELVQQPIAKEWETARQIRPFEELIELDKVTFGYESNSPDVLKDLTLSIPKGSHVGFVGETGSGKSTLIDVVMGLLQPSKGRFLIDGVLIDGAARLGWQRNIAHVPQSIFLIDATFAENIAFGVPRDKIDIDRVRAAARSAHIDHFIEGNPGKYTGLVGERGVRLSGGQRQRVGIARAVYKNAPVLILDEATSALDCETEAAVIESVFAMNSELTVMMIAHRLSTLAECDFIVTIDNGRITSIKHKAAPSSYTR